MPQDEQQLKFERMTTRRVERLVAGLAAPSVLSMLITAFYNIVDTFYVGRLGSSATGAIGVAYSLMAIIQSIGFGFGCGSGICVSRKLGERDVAEASVVATVGFASALAAGACIALFGFLTLSVLPFWLGSTSTIAPLARRYMSYILVGAPFFAGSIALNNQLRLQGNARPAVVGIAAGAVLNCLLDPLLIFHFRMGVGGAGLATMLSQLLSLSLLLLATERSDAVKLRPRNFRPTRARYLAILRGGLPSVGRQGMQSVVNILLNHVMKAFGDNLFAAMTIVMRLSNFLFAVTAGIGHGFQPVCGFNYGARRFDRVLSAYFFTQRLAVGILLVLTALLFCLASAILGAFSSSSEVVRLGVLAQRLQCIGIPFMGFCIIAGMFFQNVGRYVQATVVSVSRNGIFFIPAIVVLPLLCGRLGVMLAQPVADLLSFLFIVWMHLSAVRSLRRSQG